MANAFVNAYLNGILGLHATQVKLQSDTIKMGLLDYGAAAGTPDPVNDDFWDDWASGLVGTAYTLGAKTLGTLGAGVFDNTVDPAPAFVGLAGASCEGLGFFKDTGTPATSNLICFFDVMSGLPLTPNGGDVNVSFHASGIWKV